MPILFSISEPQPPTQISSQFEQRTKNMNFAFDGEEIEIWILKSTRK